MSEKQHKRILDDAIRRSITRRHYVETAEHLPEAAYDAYLLATELRVLQQRVEYQNRFIQEVKQTAGRWAR